MQHEEHLEQCAVVVWASYHKSLENLMAIPNGTYLGGTKIQRANQMKRLKKEGFKTGAFDLFLPVAKNGKHGMWIEMKRVSGGKVSGEQKDFGSAMASAGYHCVIAHGAEEAIKEISEYMGITGGIL